MVSFPILHRMYPLQSLNHLPLSYCAPAAEVERCSSSVCFKGVYHAELSACPPGKGVICLLPNWSEFLGVLNFCLAGKTHCWAEYSVPGWDLVQQHNALTHQCTRDLKSSFSLSPTDAGLKTHDLTHLVSFTYKENLQNQIWHISPSWLQETAALLISLWFAQSTSLMGSETMFSLLRQSGRCVVTQGQCTSLLPNALDFDF